MTAKTLAWAVCAVVVCLFAAANHAQRPPRPERPDRTEVPPPIAEQILRQPALSPDGRSLAFVYDGDIWIADSSGGEARRLTITEDNDGAPQFSPDGRWLAFRSRRYGSDDIFVMPSRGGEARRLTFSDAAEDPCCWLPDGRGILYSCAARGRGGDLWVVRAEGGEPWPVSAGGYGESEGQASISPNGRHIAYVRRPVNPFSRRNYVGTADADIWLCDFDGRATSNHRRLTPSPAHDSYPRFMDDGTVVYVTFADGRGGAHKASRLTAVNLKGEEVNGWGGDTRLDAREISIGGGMIAFATGNYGGWRLHVGELGKRPPREVRTPAISVRTDKRTANTRVFKQTQASEFKVSPDGKKIAFVSGADVFVMPTEDGGVPRRITDSLGRDKDIDWAPDSRRLCFSSESIGGHNLRGKPSFDFWVRIADLASGAVAPIDGDGGPETHPRFLPDGERMVYLRGDSHLKRISLKDGKTQAFKGNFYEWVLPGGDMLDVSPDGKWLLFTLPNENFDDTLWVANVEAGTRRCLVCMFGDCVHGRFSRDGKRVDFACSQADSFDIYSVELTPPPVEFKEDKLDNMFKDKEEKPEGEKPKPEKGPKAPPVTSIEFEGIQKRVRRVTSLDGNELWPVSTDDGRAFYFIANVQGQNNIWKLTLDPDKGPDLKQLTQTKSQKSQLRLGPDEKSLWYLDAGVITDINLANGKTTPHPFAVEQRRDTRELRDQVFHECATNMGRNFYDRRMHGVNWEAICNRYRQALDATATGDEFGAIMNEMLGELNSSHQAFNAADERNDGLNESIGRIGLDFEALELMDGRYRVASVLRGGPCDQRERVAAPEGAPPAYGPKVAAGDYLVGVNGKELTRDGVLDRELVSTIGRKTILHFNSTPEFKGAREVAVKPMDRRTEAGLIYDTWVDEQREMVKRLSNGRLGYVHVQSMDMESVGEFKHHLGESAIGVQGVVIDVRFNGGGWTAAELLEILVKRPWLARQSRAGEHRISENVYRSVALEKPTCLMINQSSFSNAEILAEGFRRLGIGKVIGVDTAGGVIGTGSIKLSDGSTMRMPGMGAWTLEGENLELVGRKPDVYVENHPDELDRGIDRQVEAAVKTLMEEIEKK